MIESLLVKYAWQIIAGFIVTAIIWWFGFHIPAKLKATKAELEATQIALETAKRGLVLLDDIQKGRVKIDVQVQKQISSIRATVIRPGAVLIPSGMPKAMPSTAHPSH